MGVRRDGKGGVGEGGTGLGQSGGGGNAGTVVGLATRRRILAAAAMVQTNTPKKLIKQTRLHSLSSEVKLHLRLASRRCNLLLKFSPSNGAAFTE